MGRKWTPAQVSAMDQALAEAESGISELAALMRRRIAAVGEHEALGDFLAVLDRVPKSTLAASLTVAVARIVSHEDLEGSGLNGSGFNDRGTV